MNRIVAREVIARKAMPAEDLPVSFHIGFITLQNSATVKKDLAEKEWTTLNFFTVTKTTFKI